MGGTLTTLGKKKLHQRYSAEVDSAGMIRATQVPLGNAYKRKITVEEVDVDGKIVTEKGYYYI